MLEHVAGLTLLFDVNGKDVEYDLREVFEVRESDITSEMVRQASLYGFFSAMQSKMEHEAVRAKARKERAYGKADEEAREEIINSGEKIREAAVRGIVLNHPKYIEAEKDYQEMVYRKDVLYQVCRTLHMKSEMLISIGAQMRSEQSMTGMRIKEKEYDNEIEEAKRSIKSRKK